MSASRNKANSEAVEYEEVDTTCDCCAGDGEVEEDERAMSCTRCGGTGLMTIERIKKGKT